MPSEAAILDDLEQIRLRFEELTELLRHPEELKQKPSEWLPWNYRDNLSSFTAAA